MFIFRILHDFYFIGIAVATNFTLYQQKLHNYLNYTF